MIHTDLAVGATLWRDFSLCPKTGDNKVLYAGTAATLLSLLYQSMPLSLVSARLLRQCKVI